MAAHAALREEIEAYDHALEIARHELGKRGTSVADELAEALDRVAAREEALEHPSYAAYRMHASGELGSVGVERPRDRPRVRRVACSFCGSERLSREPVGTSCATCGCVAWTEVV